MNVIYRVILKVSYHSAWFDFESAEEACAFAKTALEHMVDSEDQKKESSITIKMIDESIDNKEEE